MLGPTGLTTSGLPSFATLDDVVVGIDYPDEQSPVGRYLLNDFITLSPNYAISFADSFEFIIDKRPILIGTPNYQRSYGDLNPVNILNEVTIFASPGSGLTPFDTLAGSIAFNLPDQMTDVGTYAFESVSDNYNVTFFTGGELVITPRAIGLDLAGIDRLYGDPNARERVTIAEGSMASFHDLSLIIEEFSLPDARAPAGNYQVNQIIPNANYAIEINSGQETMNITPRSLVIENRSLYRTYGDSELSPMLVGGDGFATGDTFDDLFTVVSDIGMLNTNSDAGYYPILQVSLGDTLNYTLSSFGPDVITILPRLITMDIANQDLRFPTAQAWLNFLGNEDLVLDATANNLVNGDNFDDAFPIVRYQIVDTDTPPPFATVPTINNVALPSAGTLRANPSLIGAGVSIVGDNPSVFNNQPRTIAGPVGPEGITLNKFITVFDGYDTESNYVLAGVNNGTIRLTLTPIIVPATTSLSDLQNTRLTPSISSDTLLRIEARNANLTVGSAANPPSLFEFLTSGNSDLVAEMISSYLKDILDSGTLYDFEPGSLIAEITRADGGTLEDVTPFRIQRFLERNADNPNAMVLLAGPLAAYAGNFLSKDPLTSELTK